MRLGLTCVVLLGLAGCARWTGVPAARRAALREGLAEQRIAEGVQLGLGRSAALLDCRVGADFRERCRAGVQNVWFAVRDGPEGGEIKVPQIATEAQITAFWRGLDAASFEAFTKHELPLRVDEQLRRQDDAFEPRWGMMAAITSGVTPFAESELGVKAGVRRWFTINLGGHLAVDWGARFVTNEHRMGLRVGVELSRFTEDRLWGYVGAPPASVSAFIGPRLQLAPQVMPGMRTGLGLALTDWKMAPIVIEFCADTWFLGEQSRVDLLLAVGFQI